VEEPIEEEKPEEDEEKKADQDKEEEKKPKTKTVEKTTWDWEKVNSVKPIWMRKPSEVTEEEYNEFYKSITKDYDEPLGHVHFTAEGEVSFKSILYVPKTLASDAFQNYGKTEENIKVCLTHEFKRMEIIY
jgi:heat shock protein beta